MILLAVCALLFIGLQQDPQKIASALIGKPVPTFSQADLLRTERRVTQQDLPQQTFYSMCGAVGVRIVKRASFFNAISQIDADCGLKLP